MSTDGLIRRGLLACLVTLGVTHSLCSRSAIQPGPLSDVTPAQVDEIFSRWNRTDSPGCALAVIHGDHIIYEHGYGMADLSHDAVITPRTLFHVASVSKQFTAAAILLLVEQGKLSLGDDVRQYIPELHDFGVRVSIGDLLHHTSGLRDQWALLGMAGYRYSLDLITDEDVMSLVTRQRELNFRPGSEYLYSNTGYTLLGQIVKRVSGESLRKFTTKNLFEPLGMSATHFRDDHAEINKGEALGYVAMPDGTYRLSVTNFDTVGPTSLYTSVEDLAKWQENFDAPKIGGADFAAKMTQTVKLSSGQQNYYAMGLMVLRYRGLPIVEHSGGDAGYRADVLRFPEEHFSIVSLCNTPTAPVALNRKVADLYLAARFSVPPAASFIAGVSMKSVPDALLGKAGIFLSRDSGTVVKLGTEDGVLQILTPAGKIPLRTDGQCHFLFPGDIDPIHFEQASSRQEPRMVVQGEGKPPEIWDRLPPYSMAAGAQDVAGVYYSEELDTSYAIDAHDGKVLLRRKKFPTDELTPIARDVFASSQGGTIQFARDSKGTVVGLQVTAARARNLKFVRQGPMP